MALGPRDHDRPAAPGLLHSALELHGVMVVEKYAPDSAGDLVAVGCAQAKNTFVLPGINELWRLVTGASAAVFDQHNAQIGVGDGNTPPAIGQDGLAGPRKSFRPMDDTYPSLPANGALLFRATFGPNDANHEWNEFVVSNGATGICLDRGAGAMGTKLQGSTWIATVTLGAA